MITESLPNNGYIRHNKAEMMSEEFANRDVALYIYVQLSYIEAQRINNMR
jgi:hypothetical protein